MQPPGSLDEAEAAAATARASRQAQAQAQVAMSDLGTAATIDSDAYMAQADSRGNLVRTNHFKDAQIAAQVQHRRVQLQSSANAATAAWNNPDSIPGSYPQDLEDLFGGQGHRQQFTHAAAPVRAGASTIPRTRSGPRPAGNPANGPAAASASSSTRQRAGSPTAHGTIRDVGGQRLAVPLPNRLRQPARDGSFAGPVPNAPRIPPRQPILQAEHASRSSGHDGTSPGPVPGAPRMATRQPVLPASQVSHILQVPQAPRLAPVQPVLPVPQGPLLTPAQPAAQVDRQTSVANQATRQPANGPAASGPAQRDQKKVNQIFDAIDSANLLFLMTSNSQDGAQIFSAKVHVRACAVKTSEPSAIVISKGPLWLAIFHAVRKALITLAIEIAFMDETYGREVFNRTEEKYLGFDFLFRDVLQAGAVVKGSAEITQAIKDKWTSVGKKDVLDRVMEKEFETSIEQTIERLGSLSINPQPLGISTTITGPVTPVTRVQQTVHYNSAGQVVNVVDGGSQEGQPAQLPSGVSTSLTLILDRRLTSGVLLPHHVEALEKLVAALRSHYDASDYMSEADDSSYQSA